MMPLYGVFPNVAARSSIGTATRAERHSSVINIHNLPLAKKFALAFALVCAFSIGLGVYTTITLHKVSKTSGAIADHDFPAIVYLAAARTDINQVRRSDLAILLCPSQDCVASEKTSRNKAVADFRAQLTAFEPFDLQASERSLTQQFSSGFLQYVDFGNRALALEAEGKSKEAAALLTAPDTKSVFHSALDLSSQDVTFSIGEGQDDVAAAETALQRAAWVNISITLAVVLLSAFIGWLLTHVIAPRIAKGTALVERMARKDLTAHVRVMGTDEIGRLGVALNTCADSFREVLQSVARGADTLAASTTEISTAAEQSAANARTQSGKTNQIASAAQEMTVTIGEISRNADQAAHASRESAQVAEQGGAVMQSATATMEKIAAASGSVSAKMTSLAQRSEEIGKVVSVIQEISEQTNLLALNAAIESARAGVHGRGFAVVAGEVRRLAERTKGATEEIAATIRSIQEETRGTLEVMQHSQAAVNTGIEETTRARQSLSAIIESSRQVEQQIQMIASAATEQTSASEEISQSAGEISQLSTENAHGADQAVEALRGLASLANDLDGMIRQFQLEDASQPGAAFSGRSNPAKHLATHSVRP
jgi:methyl-accepting chemotaxis protein